MITHSVERSIPETEAAFSRVILVTCIAVGTYPCQGTFAKKT
ncbi:hypothetical protein HNP24_002767 [Chryseobacterium sediminis]|uniref:Uncharacterized protein n=1 Tax=Chryseobacterium sediminis TaxID=1679494 RepID=A0ABR6Q3D3_9FLAO|nr:hypothetical protein [Chryseobacterium sediminis]MBB6331817.1 hypothetical protein [Chryseobacterium sediminis]